MTVRFDDAERTLALSVRDLVEAGPPSGHLVLEAPQTRAARMAAGRDAHLAWQAARAEEDETFRAEAGVRHILEVDGWTVDLQGRVDGLAEEGGRTIVEEVKSTALDAGRLAGTSPEDWPAWLAQLEVYLWMLHRSGWPDPLGRLVLVSLLDGSRHILGVPLDADRVEDFVRRRAARLVRLREAKLAWWAERRQRTLHTPFPAWRPGQQDITDRVRSRLAEGRRLLVEAPTGIGKTAAILHGALSHALGTNRQIFWATSRNTQQAGVLATLQRFVDQGTPLRWVGLRAKDKTCLNDVVACRPDVCRFARDYYDKVDAGRVVETAAAEGRLDPERAMALGREHEVCPHQLTLDTTEHVDVVVGDVNHAVSPTGRVRRLFGDDVSDGMVLVVDEAHQLVERARDHLSPTVDAALARRARDELDDAFEPWAELAGRVVDAVLEVCDATAGPFRHDEAEAELAMGPWRDLAADIDALALDHALLRAQRGDAPGDEDPWVDVSRQVLSFAAAIEEAGAERVALVRVTPGAERLRLLCLDPSPMLRPWFEALGGFVGCSATLTPHAFYRDLLGLPEATDRLETPSPFPPERRAIVVAPRVSTRFKDRARDADPTAKLLSDCARAVPGNVAIYFPSFAMLEDLAPRFDLGGRELLAQHRGMEAADRAAWLTRMSTGGDPVVLAAVLGGIFAEGVDLPPGALSAVFVVGPALPPVGLERDLLRTYYDERFGEGFRYASLVPGMTKVVQAAGRLIRRPDDRGVILLVGRRFRWRDHRELLPPDWEPAVENAPHEHIAAFFAEVDA